MEEKKRPFWTTGSLFTGVAIWSDGETNHSLPVWLVYLIKWKLIVVPHAKYEAFTFSLHSWYIIQHISNHTELDSALLEKWYGQHIFTSGVQLSSKLQVKNRLNQSVILSVLFSKCFPLTESCTHGDLSIHVSCFPKGDLSSLQWSCLFPLTII